jgi:hypothetical protein
MAEVLVDYRFIEVQQRRARIVEELRRLEAAETPPAGTATTSVDAVVSSVESRTLSVIDVRERYNTGEAMTSL